jgi:hypothetical protein
MWITFLVLGSISFCIAIGCGAAFLGLYNYLFIDAGVALGVVALVHFILTDVFYNLGSWAKRNRQPAQTYALVFRIVGWCFLAATCICVIVYIALALRAVNNTAIVLVIAPYAAAFALGICSGLCFLVDIIAAIVHGPRISTSSGSSAELSTMNTLQIPDKEEV